MMCRHRLAGKWMQVRSRMRRCRGMGQNARERDNASGVGACRLQRSGDRRVLWRAGLVLLRGSRLVRLGQGRRWKLPVDDLMLGGVGRGAGAGMRGGCRRCLWLPRHLMLLRLRRMDGLRCVLAAERCHGGPVQRRTEHGSHGTHVRCLGRGRMARHVRRIGRPERAAGDDRRCRQGEDDDRTRSGSHRSVSLARCANFPHGRGWRLFFAAFFLQTRVIGYLGLTVFPDGDSDNLKWPGNDRPADYFRR